MIDFGLGVQLDVLLHGDNQLAREWRNDPKIWRWTRQNDLITEYDQKMWFDAQAADPTVKMYSILHEGNMIGVCGLTSIDLNNRRAEFSLYICPAYQGKHLSSPALLTLFYHGFKNMNLHLIWGETLDGNKAATLFSKLGMVRDGVRRDFYWKDGRYWDAILFSIKKDDFLIGRENVTCF